jgi:hypothetical protein
LRIFFSFLLEAGLFFQAGGSALCFGGWFSFLGGSVLLLRRGADFHVAGLHFHVFFVAGAFYFRSAARLSV